MSVVAALRILGITQLVLGFGHALLWHLFGWTRETRAMSPLTARVFAVHTFFVAFVIVLLGALSAAEPELLLAPAPLARLVSAGACSFWFLRLLAQPLVFDPVLLRGSRWRLPVRVVATLYFASATLVYAWTFASERR